MGHRCHLRAHSSRLAVSGCGPGSVLPPDCRLGHASNPRCSPCHCRSTHGNCYDNAFIESFWSSLKYELVYHHRFATLAQARSAIFHYIETFYNRTRLHSSLDYRSPISFESQLNQITLTSLSEKTGQAHADLRVFMSEVRSDFRSVP